MRTSSPASAARPARRDAHQSFPAAFDQLEEDRRAARAALPRRQDIEFTVEQGRLYLLQTRSAKRTAAAAVRAAVAMVEEGLLSREDAIARIDPAQLDHLLHPTLDPAATYDVVARGLAASAWRRLRPRGLRRRHRRDAGRAGEDVILVRWETSPDDIHGLVAANGMLTAHGGIASHAALVARGMGKPCGRLRRPDDRPRAAGRDDRWPSSRRET